MIPSLLQIPSAVSDSKLHSVLPNNGKGDFTFNRDSDATRVNSEGLIERVGYYGSEEVSNGDFSQSGTVTSTSWTLGWQSTDTGISIANGNLILARATSDCRAYATDGSSSINVVTSGKKYKLTYTVIANSDNADLFYHNGGSYVTAPNSEGTHTIDYTTAGTIFLFRNNTNNTTIKIDNVSLKEVTGDRARLSYDITNGVVEKQPHLLLEPSSTNLITFSKNYTDSGWLKQQAGIASVPVVTSNYAISPDGTQNADRVVFNLNGATNTDFSQLAISVTTSSGDISNSVYIKSNTSSNYVINLQLPQEVIRVLQ